jgi:hypothetical protein
MLFDLVREGPGGEEFRAHRVDREELADDFHHILFAAKIITVTVLGVGVQNPAPRFRQRVGCEEKHAVGRDREDRNRVGERC